MPDLKVVPDEVAELAAHLTKDQPETFRLVLAGRLQDALEACHLVLVPDPDRPYVCIWCDKQLAAEAEDWTFTSDDERIHREPCLVQLIEDNRRLAREGPTREVFRLHAPGCTLARSHPGSACASGPGIADRPHHQRCCAEDPHRLGDYCTVPDDDEVDLTGVSGG